MRRVFPFTLGLVMAVGMSVRPAVAQEATAPAVVSHDLEGRDNCLMCHKTGVMEAPVAPAESHAEKTNETCLMCHGADSPMQSAQPPAIPHDLEGKDNCLMCHKTGVMEAPKAPESHAKYESAQCRTCHEPAG